MDLQLRGHTAIVVGSARGIGLAIAEEFARAGCNLALVDREAILPGVLQELTTTHQIRGSAFVGDVTKFDAMQNAAAQFQRDLGRLDHLVYAVAIGSGKFGFPFWNLTPADWPRVLEINVLGAVNTLHAFAPYYVEAKTGTMLLIASVAGQIGSQTDPPYSASKAALINFAQCAAKDFAPYGVRVNTLCPGMVKTELNRAVWQSWADQQSPETWRSYDDWAGDKVRKVVPLGRWQEPADIAAMTVFLASARANNVTGQTINVDGGFVMHW